MTGCQPVPPESIWNLESAKNGMISASEGGVRLHSAYNPEREAAGAVGREEVFEKLRRVPQPRLPLVPDYRQNAVALPLHLL